MINKIKDTSNAIKALEGKKFFKLVCGASLTDTDMIEKLSFLFTLAGAHVIDLAPRADVIVACHKGIQKALQFSNSPILQSSNPPILQSPLVMASIHLDTDPHFRKVKVDYNLCDLCGACIKVCPTEAFQIENKSANTMLIYKEERCFGCNICPEYCHVNALTMTELAPNPVQTLKEMVMLGIYSIEFHFGKSYKKLKELWPEIKNALKKVKLLSFSIGSELLSEDEIKEAARMCYQLAGRHIILQCDGKPMSGGSNKGNNTDKDTATINVAKLIQKENLPVYLQLAGGTTEYSFQKALSQGIYINGVAIGSHARKILMPYLNDRGIQTDKIKLHEALCIAKKLVNSAVAGK